MKLKRMLCSVILLLLAANVSAQEEPGKIVSLGEAVEHAMQQSKLAVPGGTPFHLKAHITTTASKAADYSADVEEYWLAPEKWRRTVKSAAVSQTLVKNGDQISQELTGDYYPFWLQDLVTALFDPLPMAEQLKHKNTQLEIPQDSTKSNSCVNLQSKAGIAPVENNVAYVFCFGGKLGLLQAAVTPGYRAQFADYLPFKQKLVARTISADFAPEFKVTARITELVELTKADESLFAIENPTPAAELIKSTQVGEDTTRALAVHTAAINWPPIREGKTSGVLSLYISTDRSGRIREAWPVGTANPELINAAREQMLHWQYKPYANGGPSQLEAILTFAFTTRIENPIPVLTDAQARKLALRIVEAVSRPGVARKGTRFTLRASVDEAGRVQNVQNLNVVPPALYQAGTAALKRWLFRPYMNNGKPDRFYADITFQVR